MGADAVAAARSPRGPHRWGIIAGERGIRATEKTETSAARRSLTDARAVVPMVGAAAADAATVTGAANVMRRAAIKQGPTQRARARESAPTSSPPRRSRKKGSVPSRTILAARRGMACRVIAWVPCGRGCCCGRAESATHSAMEVSVEHKAVTRAGLARPPRNPPVKTDRARAAASNKVEPAGRAANAESAAAAAVLPSAFVDAATAAQTTSPNTSIASRRPCHAATTGMAVLASRTAASGGGGGAAVGPANKKASVAREKAGMTPHKYSNAAAAASSLGAEPNSSTVALVQMPTPH